MTHKTVLRKKSIQTIIIAFLIFIPFITLAQVKDRFPKPDFQIEYKRPELKTPDPRSPLAEYVDVLVLLAALSLASFFAIKQRSRRRIFLVMVFSLVYFGFYREGCICSIGAIQNISYALFHPNYFIPLTVVAFFIIPLLFTLLFGRTFCAAVCPLGAIQDLVVLKPVSVPKWLDNTLGMIPYLYLGLAILFASTGAGFIICQYDPFVGFFRFGVGFNMLIFGLAMLLLGIVVARPFCRYLCPYGVLLNWMSRLSKRHVTITPNDCNNCRLCEESCPFGAIKLPNDSQPPPQNREREIKRLTILLILLPVVVVASGWIVSRLYVPLSRQHVTVSLAEEVLQEDSGTKLETSERTRTFRASGKPTDSLVAEALEIQKKFKIGGWILGILLGLIFSLKLIALSIQKRRTEYTIDTGTCLSCGRCFIYCPYEQVRLGIITPEEIPEAKSESIGMGKYDDQ